MDLRATVRRCEVAISVETGRPLSLTFGPNLSSGVACCKLPSCGSSLLRSRLVDRHSEAPPSEQRRYVRYKIWFPVTLEVGTGQVWGICRDVSSKGIMISSGVTLERGDRVRAIFKIAPEGEEHRVPGIVVRSWRNDDELHLAFPFRLAVEFDEAIADLEPRLRESIRPPEPS